MALPIVLSYRHPVSGAGMNLMGAGVGGLAAAPCLAAPVEIAPEFARISVEARPLAGAGLASYSSAWVPALAPKPTIPAQEVVVGVQLAAMPLPPVFVAAADPDPLAHHLSWQHYKPKYLHRDMDSSHL